MLTGVLASHAAGSAYVLLASINTVVTCTGLQELNELYQHKWCGQYNV